MSKYVEHEESSFDKHGLINCMQNCEEALEKGHEPNPRLQEEKEFQWFLPFGVLMMVCRICEIRFRRLRFRVLKLLICFSAPLCDILRTVGQQVERCCPWVTNNHCTREGGGVRFMPHPPNEADLTTFHRNQHFYCQSPWDILPENHLYTVVNGGEINTALINRFQMAARQLYAVIYEEPGWVEPR